MGKTILLKSAESFGPSLHDGEVGDQHGADFPRAVRVDLGVQLQVDVSKERTSHLSRGHQNFHHFQKDIFFKFYL